MKTAAKRVKSARHGMETASRRRVVYLESWACILTTDTWQTQGTFIDGRRMYIHTYNRRIGVAPHRNACVWGGPKKLNVFPMPSNEMFFRFPEVGFPFGYWRPTAVFTSCYGTERQQ